MVLINLTVKLINRDDAAIIIDNQSTISQLRDKIADEIEITRETQRLIFRGKLLSNDSLKLQECGLEDKMAIHVVTRPIPSDTYTSSSSTSNNQFHQPFPPNVHVHHAATNQPHIVTQNVIYGQVPFERTQIFSEPNNALTIVGNITESLRNVYRMEAEQALLMNSPRNNDFLINITFRSIRQLVVDSSAYERFDNLKNSIKSLAWLVALIKSQLLEKIDLIISGEEIDTERQYRNIANILWVMHAFDGFDERQMNNLIQNDYDVEISSLIEQLNEWQLPTDDDHIQHINHSNHSAIVRHCTSHDLSTLLIIFSVIEAKINEHLMNRYYRILSLNHIFEDASYASRLLNYFCNGIKRIQHSRAFIHGEIGSFSLNLNENLHNRLYPIYDQFRRIEEPLRAEISFLFSDASANLSSPNVIPTSQSQTTITTTESNNSNSDEQHQTPRNLGSGALSSVINGFTQFAQQFMSRQPQNVNQSSSSSGSSSEISVNQNEHPPNISLPQISVQPVDSFNSNFNAQEIATDIANHIQRLISQDPDSTGQQTRPPLGDVANDIQQLIAQNVASTGQQTRPMESSRTTTPRNIMLVGVSSQSTEPIIPRTPIVSSIIAPQMVNLSNSTFAQENPRDSNFWNDPQTIALGLLPPPPLLPHQIIQNRSSSSSGQRRFSSIRGEQIANMFREGIRIRPQSNSNGEAVFNEIDQFAIFVRQTLESIVNCMAQHDSSLIRDEGTRTEMPDTNMRDDDDVW